jgi:membrane-associated phospholipid phosphatase
MIDFNCYSVIASVIATWMRDTMAESAAKFRASMAALLAILFVVALALDVPASTWVHETGLSADLKDHWWLTHIVRLPGNAWGVFASVTTIFWVTWYRGKSLASFRKDVAIIFRRVVYRINGEQLSGCWRDTAIIVLSSAFSAINAVLKWIFGRIRPFHGSLPFQLHPFRGGFHGAMLSEQNLSFPSGDASLAFALSAALAMVVPRHQWLWWTLAIIVSLERIAEGAHYPSDVVAGAALGIGVAMLARRLVRPQMNSSELARGFAVKLPDPRNTNDNPSEAVP